MTAIDDLRAIGIDIKELTDEEQELLKELLSARESRRETSYEELKENYLATRERDLASSSWDKHRRSLEYAVTWFTEFGPDDPRDVDGEDLREMIEWRVHEATTKVAVLSPAAEKAFRDRVRCFVRFGENVNVFRDGLAEKVIPITLKKGESVSDKIVDTETAEKISSHLGKFNYASREHVVLEILIETGIRTGSLRSLDVDHYEPDAEVPHLSLQSQSDTDTRLKNGFEGERKVAISKELCKIIDDYLKNRRIITDEYGREPLIGTRYGRISTSTIQKYVYKWTRPCQLGLDCPHEREIESCEATTANSFSKCPDNNSPHDVRRGYITEELKNTDKFTISERCDVSPEVIEEHYDVRDEYDKMAARQKILRKGRDSDTRYGGK